MIAGAVTATVILLVMTAGASFGQFGLGGDGRSGVEASVSGQRAERRTLDGDTTSKGESDEDEEGEDDDERWDDDEDEGEHGEEHEEEDD